MATQTHSQSQRDYRNEDITDLSERARSVLLAIATQTGQIDGRGGVATDTPSDVDIATTSSVREATGLDIDAVNYDLRKLEGNHPAGVEVPLIEATQQGTDEQGRQLPKQIVLTDAGEQAVEDGVIERPQLHTGPDWYPDQTAADTEVQLRAIASRIEKHEQILTEITRHIGLAAFNSLLEAEGEEIQEISRREVIEGNSEIEPFTTADEYTILEALERMYIGQRALKKALSEMDVDPSKYIED